jgi:hypothetical protein
MDVHINMCNQVYEWGHESCVFQNTAKCKHLEAHKQCTSLFRILRSRFNAVVSFIFWGQR